MISFGKYEPFKCEVFDLNGESHILTSRKMTAKESNEISKIVKDYSIESGDKVIAQMKIVFGSNIDYNLFDMLTMNQIIIAYSDYNTEIVKKK